MNRTIRQCLWAIGVFTVGTVAAYGSDGAQRPAFADAVHQVAARAGVTITVSPCLANDPFSRPIPATLTKASIAELLEGYNYWVIEGSEGRIVKVVVSGRADAPSARCENAAVGSDSAERSQSPTHGDAMLFRYDPVPAELPERYKQLPSGSISPISLPIDELNRMELGERLAMTLPDGQYGVVLENRFEHDNGDVTWVGYLDGLDSSDRAIVTGGAAGCVGQVVTPEATYSIEFEAGRSWLVDTGRGELQAAVDSFSPTF